MNEAFTLAAGPKIVAIGGGDLRGLNVQPRAIIGDDRRVSEVGALFDPAEAFSGCPAESSILRPEL